MWWTVHLLGGPRRVNHAAVSVGDRIYSFGGYCTGDNYRDKNPIDVFVLSTETYRWVSIPKPDKHKRSYENWPYQRYAHTVAAKGEIVYLFGGRNDTSLCNTLYSFDTATYEWSKPKVSGQIPAERDGHSACIISDSMYIFGGYEETIHARDVYKLDLSTFIWTMLTCSGEPPLYRDFHSATAIGNCMFIFGGRSEISSQEVYSNKVCYLDTVTLTWNTPLITGSSPSGRRSHSAVNFHGKLLIFGGFNGADHKNDLWSLDAGTWSWTRHYPSGEGPNPRRRQALCQVGNRLFLFGGTSPYDGPPIYFTEEQLMYLHPNAMQNDSAKKLIDHNDLFVLDASPTLKTLCCLAVIKYGLDTFDLPHNLKQELHYMTEPNNISGPLRTLPLG